MFSPGQRRSNDISFSRPSSSSGGYPFPPQGPSRRPGQGSRAHSRQSSITSIGGILDSSLQGRDNALAESGHNAISTLLQPPIVRTGFLPHTSGPTAQKPPSSKDIPPVTLTNIPHVDSNAFKPYLAQAGSLYDAFRRAKEDGGDSGTQLFRKTHKADKSSEPHTPTFQRRASGTPSTPSQELLSPSIKSPSESPQSKRKTSGSSSRRAGLAMTPLSTIPNVYFEDDFHIENPRTFDIISERSEIVRPPSGPNGTVTTPGASGKKALATNAILQEKLSWYMDTVEIHLISSISTASSSFFAALGSLRQLHSEAAESVSKIKSLRQDLANLDKDMATGGLKIIKARRRQENVRKLGNAVSQLNRVVELVIRNEEQMDRGQIEEALDGLAEVEKLIAGELDDQADMTQCKEPLNHRGTLIDLRGAKALEGSENDIALLRKRIGKAFEARFIETLLGDLRKHVDSVDAGTTLQRWDKASPRNRGGHARTPSVFPSYLHLDDHFRSTLSSNLKGLARSESVIPATMAYREAVLREVKSLIRRHLPSSNDDDNESTMSTSTQESRRMSQQEKSSILARNLRSLDARDAEDMLKKIYTNVGEALRRLGSQVKVLLDVTSSIASPQSSASLKSSVRSPRISATDKVPQSPVEDSENSPSIQQEDILQALDLSNLLGQAVDIAQAQITKVLKVRSEQSTSLTLSDFLRYFNLNKLFADECEAVSGRGGAALKTVVNNHIKDFVSRFGDSEKQRMVQSMDSDRWDARDFSETHTESLALILEGSTRDNAAWTRDFLIWEDTAMSNGEAKADGAAINGTSSKDKIRSATIDGQKYILPESAMTILSGIEHFEHLITGIPSMTQEITSSLLDYLKLFNSRSSQLILGAGATRSAGLKNITTKHLALSSQALSFLIALIPYMREFVRRQPATSGNLMIEFDKVKRLCQEHQSGIHDKLVDIMSGRASTHVSTMKKIDWDVPTNSQAVSSYMETLVKETTTLHKVLSKNLPEITVSMIMGPVFGSYREQLGNALTAVELKSPLGKERLLRDFSFLKSRMSKIDGAGDLGDFLVDLVTKLPVAHNPDFKPSPANDSTPTDQTAEQAAAVPNGEPAKP